MERIRHIIWLLSETALLSNFFVRWLNGCRVFAYGDVALQVAHDGVEGTLFSRPWRTKSHSERNSRHACSKSRWHSSTARFSKYAYNRSATESQSTFRSGVQSRSLQFVRSQAVSF